MDDQELKDVLDRAAAAVGHLPAALQPVAFSEAVRLLVVGTSTTKDTGSAKPPSKTTRPTSEARKPKTRKARAKRLTPSLDRGLNLHPKGKASLQAFYKEKAPMSQDEHNVVFVHYLPEHREHSEAVTVNQVYTSYREVNARTPSDLRNSLRATSAKKGWIDSGDIA